jgi:hypothetical protein
MGQASQHQNHSGCDACAVSNAFDGLYVHSYRARAAM